VTDSRLNASPVTRLEIAGVIGDLFGFRGVHRNEMLDAARGANARARVIDLLSMLPTREYSDLRQIWEELPEIPVR
jgi:hypothetical protein